MVLIVLTTLITFAIIFFLVTINKIERSILAEIAIASSWSNLFAKQNLEDKKNDYRKSLEKAGKIPKNASKKIKKWDKHIAKYSKQEADYASGKRFSFEDVITVFGYQIIELFNISLTKTMHDFIRACEFSGFEKLERGIETAGKRNSHLYATYIMSKFIGFSYIGIVVALFIALIFTFAGRTFTNVALFSIVGYVVVFIIGYLPFDEINVRKNKRQEEIDRDFPNLISKITLLVNAGMNIVNALEEAAKSGDSVIYNELKRVVKEVKQSVSISAALSDMQTRCKNSYLDKMVSLISKSYVSGNATLGNSLMEINEECWFNKRQQAMRISASVQAKLLLPSFLMLAGIIIVIIIPAMSGMGL